MVGFFIYIMELLTKKGIKFLIDDEDYYLVNLINWEINNCGYIKGWCKQTKKNILLHRLVMNTFNSKLPFVDHKNRDKKDNRKINLRLCTPSENQKNKKSTGKSRYLGVKISISTSKYINSKGEIIIYKSPLRFVAQISIDGKQRYLGTFKTEIEAAKKYNELAIKHHGEFANLNKI